MPDSLFDEDPTTDPLNDLWSARMGRLVDLVNDLRQIGLQQDLDLPQIVVTGDQSAGKSSVLHAISGIEFPRNIGLCTRFATEIVLRRSRIAQGTVKIRPDGSAPLAQQERLRSYHQAVASFNTLPTLIDEAASLMDVGPGQAGPGIAKHVLNIEIQGPEHPNLALVDLPGIVHAALGPNSRTDIKAIDDLIESYLSNRRTIILAVIPATSDCATQAILQRYRQWDRHGERTLGVVTKPDQLEAGSREEQACLRLVQNADSTLLLRGWHVLRNSYADRATRDAEEENFFALGSWAFFPAESKGAEQLRKRLSRLLYEHLCAELPTIRAEIEAMRRCTQLDLSELGDFASTQPEQSSFLIGIGSRAQHLSYDGIRGTYTDPFFEPPEGEDENVDTLVSGHRLRAAVRQHTAYFGARMRSQGHRYDFVRSPEDRFEYESTRDSASDAAPTPSPGSPDQQSAAPMHDSAAGEQIRPTPLSHAEALDWVKKVIRDNQAEELNQLLNPAVIGALFRTQSKQWSRIARDYTESVAATCYQFILAVFSHVTAPHIAERVMTQFVVPAMERIKKEGGQELDQLLIDKNREPQTEDTYLVKKVYKERVKMAVRPLDSGMGPTAAAALRGLAAGALLPSSETNQYVNLSKVTKAVCQAPLDPPLALAYLRAYYKIERRFFIDAVTKQVTERHFMVRLVEDVFTPSQIGKIPHPLVAELCKEPADIAKRRASLQARSEGLQKAAELISEAMEERDG